MAYWAPRSALDARSQVIVNRIAERFLQFGDALALERDHIAGIDHVPVKNTSFIIEFDFAEISFVLHFIYPRSFQ
jgi:hypothetical protein